MLSAGILFESEPVELLEGVVLKKFRPMSPRECARQMEYFGLNLVLEPLGWHVWLGTAVTLEDSEPEPDVAILRGDEGVFRKRFAGPNEIGAVIEVADASLEFDRVVKGRIYARAGVPAYWVVNVVDRQIEVYTNPQPAANPPAYATRTDYPHGGTVPVVLDGVTVATLAVADLIP